MSLSFRERAVAYARTLIGTPFHHAARLPGVGVDCVGVVVLTGAHLGAWPEGFDVDPYGPLPRGFEMRTTCRQHLRKITQAQMQPGDIVLMTTDVFPQHVGIVGDFRGTHHRSIIHASNLVPNPRVIETPLAFSRQFKFSEAYSFPLEED